MKVSKIICVIGPTASGKSELAVSLAKKYNGEIISCDSRQIYRGFDIGSGKVEGSWQNNQFIYKHIPHYLIDEASPKVQYSVARFQKNARKLIADILRRGKLPILCGGTGYWIDAVVFEQTLPEVKPNSRLRSELTGLTTEQMFEKLANLDPDRALEIDAKNPHRLIRALEIVMTTGKPVPKTSTKSLYDITWLGINPGMEVLEQKIKKRLSQRLKQGMLKEIKELHNTGKLSWKKLESFGLEYKFCALFLQGKITEPEMEKQLFTAIRQYAKRQLTWWKRNPDITWSSDPKELMVRSKNLLN